MEDRGQEGFTLMELLIVVAIISIVAAIAIPGLLRARMTSNESSAIASLRATTSAQISFSAACGSGGYASGYVLLGTPVNGGLPFISQDLGAAAQPWKSGYTFDLVPGAAGLGGPPDCHGNAVTASGFYATATPDTVGITGTRGFAVNIGMTVWQDTTGVPPAENAFAAAGTTSAVQ